MRFSLFLTLAALSMLLFGGCSSEPPAEPISIRNESPAEKVDEVELALNWLPEAEHGGFFAAEVHGLFAERQLKVKIIPGGPGVPVIQNVATGKATFGVTNADQVLVQRSGGGRRRGLRADSAKSAVHYGPQDIGDHKV